MCPLATPRWPSKYYDIDVEANDLTNERLERITVPKLFIAGADDVQTPAFAPLRPGVARVYFAEDAQSMFDAAPEPKQIEIVNSGHHSSALVTTAGKDTLAETRSIIVRFLETYS